MKRLFLLFFCILSVIAYSDKKKLLQGYNNVLWGTSITNVRDFEIDKETPARYIEINRDYFPNPYRNAFIDFKDYMDVSNVDKFNEESIEFGKEFYHIQMAILEDDNKLIAQRQYYFIDKELFKVIVFLFPDVSSDDFNSIVKSMEEKNGKINKKINGWTDNKTKIIINSKSHYKTIEYFDIDKEKMYKVLFSNLAKMNKNKNIKKGRF